MKSYIVFGSETETAHKMLQGIIRENMGSAPKVDLTGEALEAFKAMYTEVGFEGEVIAVDAARLNSFPQRTIQYRVVLQRGKDQSCVTWGMVD